MVLNKRQIDIIKFLKDIEEWITIKTVANKFDVSERTIRNDLDVINIVLNKENIKIEKKPKIGIKIIIINQNLDDIISSYDNKIYSSNQRAMIIAIILLIKEYSTIECLAKEMQVSKNTVVNDLKLVEKVLFDFDVTLIKESYKGISIKEDFRKQVDIFLKIYKDLDDGQFKKVNNLLYKYSNLDSDAIKNLIEKIEVKNNIKYTYDATLELETILLFAFCKKYKEQSINTEDKDVINLKNIIEDEINIKLGYDVLKTLVIMLKNQKKTNYNKDDKVENDINKITNEIVDEMCTMFSIEKEPFEEFINQMKMHLNIAIHRVRNNLLIENPMLEETKYKMPFIFEITNKILKDKKDLIGFLFPEEEVAFMAMYFGILFEKHLKENINTNVLIVCNGGLATSSLLKSRLTLMLPELKIKAICSVREMDRHISKDIDFIISTVSIKVDGYKVINVSPLLEVTDCEKIKSEIYNKWYEKNCKYIAEKVKEKSPRKIQDIIPEKYTQFDIDIIDWRQVVEIATKPLIEDNKVKKGYVNDIISIIEKFGNYMVFMPEVAFIHAYLENVMESSVSYLNLKNKIEFGVKDKSLVKTIVVLANKEENKNLIDIVNILEKDNNLSLFKNAKEYKQISDLN